MSCHELLSKLELYKCLLTRKDIDRYLTPEEDDILTKLIGEMHYLIHERFLIDVVCFLENEIAKEHDVIEKLKKENIELKAQVAAMNSAVNGNEQLTCHKGKLKNGQKIAYIEAVNPEEVKRLKDEGLTIVEIASIMGVSKTTIWRRLKEPKEKNHKLEE